MVSLLLASSLGAELPEAQLVTPRQPLQEFPGAWSEHWQDPRPPLRQARFHSAQRHQSPEVIAAFGSDQPSSGSFLLHYAGDPPEANSLPPLLLVQGAKVDGLFYLRGLAPFLRQRGFRVYAITFAHNQDDNLLQAQSLAQALGRIRQLSGAPQVDLVAHSKGCLAALIYATPGFHPTWMSPYACDIRRMLLVGGPVGGLDYFHRYPSQERGQNNWPMVWSRWGDEDCRPWLLDKEGYWPGQAQMVARWDHRYPVPESARLSYYGGQCQEFEAPGIEAAIQSGENFLERLGNHALDPTIEVGLLAGSRPDVPGFANELAGPSDGIILVDSALTVPKGARLVFSEVLDCNHLQLILGAEAQKTIACFLEAERKSP